MQSFRKWKERTKTQNEMLLNSAVKSGDVKLSIVKSYRKTITLRPFFEKWRKLTVLNCENVVISTVLVMLIDHRKGSVKPSE